MYLKSNFLIGTSSFEHITWKIHEYIFMLFKIINKFMKLNNLQQIGSIHCRQKLQWHGVEYNCKWIMVSHCKIKDEMNVYRRKFFWHVLSIGPHRKITKVWLLALTDPPPSVICKLFNLAWDMFIKFAHKNKICPNMTPLGGISLYIGQHREKTVCPGVWPKSLLG